MARLFAFPRSWRETLIIAEAWFAMLWISAVLRTRWRKLLFMHGGSAESKLSEIEVRRAAKLVQGVANHSIKPMSCLERALTLQYILGRRGCCTDLRVGVQKNGANLEAHAWLEGPLGLSDALSGSFVPLKGCSGQHRIG
jgi:hypothetical protein